MRGNQEKYYRKIYGRAATRRLATSKNVVYPTNPTHGPSENIAINQIIQSKSIANILDDPFFFGFNENGSDSGIDANYAISKAVSMENPTTM